jgi:hypothetical protein
VLTSGAIDSDATAVALYATAAAAVGRSHPVTRPRRRSFGDVGVRTWHVRLDAQHVFDRRKRVGPTLSPTSTRFGQDMKVALNQMRFVTFGVRGTL